MSSSSAAFLVTGYAPWRQRRCGRAIRTKRMELLCGRREQEQQGESEKSSENLEGENEDEKKDEGVRLEVSSTVMRMLQGSPPPASEGLIELNLRKREQARLEQQQQEDARMGFVREEVFGSIPPISVPKHDNLYPMVVTALTIVNRDEDDLGSEPLPGQLKPVVEEQIASMKSSSSLASDLFCDLNGDPLNKKADFKFERSFLLSMYVKFKLWWQGSSAAADKALDYAYRVSNYIFDTDGELQRTIDQVSGFVPGKRFAMRYGRLFLGKLTGDDPSPAAFLERLQSELDKKNRGWAAFILDPSSDEAPGEIACLITHSTSLIFLNFPEDVLSWISYFLLSWTAASSFEAGSSLLEDPSFASAVAIGLSLVQQSLIPLGLLAVIGLGTLIRKSVASSYGVMSKLNPLFMIPVSQLGGIPSFVYYKGCLPNRTCLFDISAASSMASLVLSALLIFSNAPVGAPVMVPSDLFAHSSLLNWLLSNVVAAQQSGGSEMAVNPLTLGGMLGLNFTLFSLIPLTASDGGRMIAACFGRRFLADLSSLTFILVSASLLSKNLLLGSLFAFIAAAMPEDSFQRDEVSDPGLLRKILATILTCAAIASVTPVP